MSTINNNILHNIVHAEDSVMETILGNSLYEGMTVQYLLECSRIYCDYIADINSTTGMNRINFEGFVSTKLNMYFTSTNSNEDTGSSLLFEVESMRLSSEMEVVSGIGTALIILIIFGVLCVFISGVSIGVILYHRKRQRRAPVAAEGNVHAEPPRHEEQNPNELAVPLTPISAKTSATISPSTHNAEGQEGVPATGFGFPEGEGQIMYQNSNEQGMSVELQPNEEQKHGDSDHEDSAKVPSPGKGPVE